MKNLTIVISSFLLLLLFTSCSNHADKTVLLTIGLSNKSNFAKASFIRNSDKVMIRMIYQ